MDVPKTGNNRATWKKVLAPEPGWFLGAQSISPSGYELIEESAKVLWSQRPRFRLGSWINNGQGESLERIHEWYKQPPFIREVPRDPRIAFERKRYNPMESGALHQQLTNVDLTAANCVKLANRFGFLGRQVLIIELDGHQVEVESLRFWQDSLARLRRLRKIHALVVDGSPEAEDTIRKLIDLSPIGFAGLNSETVDEDGITPCFGMRMPWWMRQVATWNEFPNGDGSSQVKLEFNAFQVAMLMIRDEINDELADGVSPQVSLVPGEWVFSVPSDLLGAAYLHFAYELMGYSRPPIKCAGCPIMFTPMRDDQIFHDDPCRNRFNSRKAMRKKRQKKSAEEPQKN